MPADAPGAASPMVVRVAADAAYAQATNVFMRYRALLEDPSAGSAALTDLLALSRKNGVLVGAASYIVVENSAQWQILEQKQKQKLSGALALEIEPVPEPSIWAMLLVGGVVLAARRRRLKTQIDR